MDNVKTVQNDSESEVARDSALSLIGLTENSERVGHPGNGADASDYLKHREEEKDERRRQCQANPDLPFCRIE